MWNPPDQVSTKEMIGRRAFGKDKSVFANSEATKYKLNVFLDDRLADNLSFDRLEHVPEKCGRFSDKDMLKIKGIEHFL